MELGQFMVNEQKRIADMALAREYNQHLNVGNRLQPGSEHLPSSAHHPPSPPLLQVPSPSPLHIYPSQEKGVQYSETHRSTINASTATLSRDGQVTPEMVDRVQALITQGCHVGIEYVDKRRFRTNSWQCWSIISSGNYDEAIAQLADCLQAHDRDYVRVVGIDPKAKKRIAEHIVHRPS